MTYLIYKALHIIAMVCWFACLFYLPRLFVYHSLAEAENDEACQKRFCVMERRLYKLGNIAMALTYVFGILLLIENSAWFKQGWIHAKMVLVLALSAYYGISGKMMKQFANGQNKRSHIFYRYFNELPTIALIAIVFLAILKPF